MAKNNRELNNIIYLFASLIIIINIPKQIWINMFFGSLVFVEITFILILSYFWLKHYILISKETCSDIETIDKINGLEFENYIKELYIKIGYNAFTTNKSHDFGADTIATRNYEKICIQAKRYNININVGISAVQEIIGSLNY